MDEKSVKKCDVCNGTGMDASLYRDPVPCKFCDSEKAGDDIETPIVMKLSDEECGRIIRALRALTATIFYLREHGAMTEEYSAWDAANTAALTTRFVQATGDKYSLLKNS